MSERPSPLQGSDLDVRTWAYERHLGQLDFNGEAHWEHVRRVAMMIPARHRAVAWLHDVLEDTDSTADDLDALGIHPVHIAAVELLTRPKDLTYAFYIERLRREESEAGEIARWVKEADLIDNLGRCLRFRNERSQSLIVRYRKALVQLYA